jgi:hypothetical protein
MSETAPNTRNAAARTPAGITFIVTDQNAEELSPMNQEPAYFALVDVNARTISTWRELKRFCGLEDSPGIEKPPTFSKRTE